MPYRLFYIKATANHIECNVTFNCSFIMWKEEMLHDRHEHSYVGNYELIDHFA